MAWPDGNLTATFAKSRTIFPTCYLEISISLKFHDQLEPFFLQFRKDFDPSSQVGPSLADRNDNI